mmetsp:Transcript_21994/g.43710  ORF Transcript_21994/g.43710 Transcript_21994/m.43710 type:complete len:125 (+) Transcript_21994:37-411(+)|eukprot:CAMPEP_0175159542 /NCGR_PEP_ID=MMETSP0087-20121206/23479_1 /TAXON_ID=136419 /ORGANISM="Unknown Unknown, Strain D1" /LENGTH=124 /DNA_ID=CAMNT_0016447601 /DNA_START=30 /DNA_END=404 /DNA_ORIENTATION=-
MVKKECPTCGFKWDRPANEAEKKICPKCQSKLEVGKAVRAPGEVSTNKVSSSSAGESSSGVCKKGGSHMWKFGKCSKCGESEGKFAKAGSAVNPGGAGGCSKGGGKCMFKFSKCTKCGKSEFSK